MIQATESQRTQDVPWEALAPWAPEDVAHTRWEAQPWRRRLQQVREHERRVARAALVEALLAEGHAAEADVAGFAGAQEDRSALSIGQVVRFADGLKARLGQARTDDELLQLAYLRRNAEELAERMIDWAHTGRL